MDLFAEDSWRITRQRLRVKVPLAARGASLDDDDPSAEKFFQEFSQQIVYQELHPNDTK
jgi:hypothetical protein